VRHDCGEARAAVRKFVGVLVFAPLGGMRMRQAVGLGCALMPMSTLALMLQHDVLRTFPEFGADLTAVFLAAVLIMEIAGPILVQWGLKLAGEAEPEPATAPITATQNATKAPGA